MGRNSHASRRRKEHGLEVAGALGRIVAANTTTLALTSPLVTGRIIDQVQTVACFALRATQDWGAIQCAVIATCAATLHPYKRCIPASFAVSLHSG